MRYFSSIFSRYFFWIFSGYIVVIGGIICYCHYNESLNKNFALEKIHSLDLQSKESNSLNESYQFSLKFWNINPEEIKKIKVINKSEESNKQKIYFWMKSQKYFVSIPQIHSSGKIIESTESYSNKIKKLCENKEKCLSGLEDFFENYIFMMVYKPELKKPPIQFSQVDRSSIDLKFKVASPKNALGWISFILSVFTVWYGLFFLFGSLILIFSYYLCILFSESKYKPLRQQAGRIEENLKRKMNECSWNIKRKQIDEIKEFIKKDAELFYDAFVEFDENLVEEENGELRNCMSSSAFFEIENLIGNNIKKDVLQQAPGILVSVGILGTFLGLAGGVQNLSMEDPEILFAGVETLMGGMSSAFLTSIFGISFASVIIWFHKHKREKTFRAIISLQTEVDKCFKRINIQEILVKSHKQLYTQSKETNERIDALLNVQRQIADAFGEKFMTNLANTISGPLNETMESIKNMFSNNVTEQGNIMKEKMGESFDEFAHAMNQSAENFSVKQGNLNETLEKVTERLNSMMNYSADHVRDGKVLGEHLMECIQMLNDQTGKLTNHFGQMNQNTEIINQKMMSTLEANLAGTDRLFSFQENITTKQKEAIEDIGRISETSIEQINGLKSISIEIKDLVANSFPRLNNSFEQFVEVIKKMEDTFSESRNLFSQFNQDFNRGTEDFKQATMVLADFKESLTQSTLHLKNSFDALLQEYRDKSETLSRLEEYQSTFLEKQRSFLSDLEDSLRADKEAKSVNVQILQEFRNLGTSMEEFIKTHGMKINEFNTELVKAFDKAYQEWDMQVAKFGSTLDSQLIGSIDDFSEDVEAFGNSIKKLENFLSQKE